MYELVVTSAFGVEACTKYELRKLGFSDPKAIEGSICVTGEEKDIPLLNMFLRTGERVYLKIGTFFADTFDSLFDGCKRLPWERYLACDGKITVNGKSKKSKLFALSSCQSILKKAILARLSEKKRQYTFPETGANYEIEFVLDGDNCTLLLNTSGKGLHKRGYRDMVAPAQMKETLASALIGLSDMSAERPFVDPFCGCGTFVIEAAMAALHIAPGKNRDFDFTSWDWFDKKYYNLALQKATDEEIDVPLHFCGYDNDPAVIKLALRHAQRAGIANKVHFQVRDIADFSVRFSEGCICCDPPYGKRLLDVNEARRLTAVLGEKFRSLGSGWSAFVISAVPDFEKRFGQKADKNRKFFNANETCHFFSYFAKR